MSKIYKLISFNLVKIEKSFYVLIFWYRVKNLILAKSVTNESVHTLPTHSLYKNDLFMNAIYFYLNTSSISSDINSQQMSLGKSNKSSMSRNFLLTPAIYNNFINYINFIY